MIGKWKNLKTVTEEVEERGSRKWRRRLSRGLVDRGQVLNEVSQFDIPEACDPGKSGERMVHRGYEAFYENIMGQRGDNKVLDTCESICKDLLCRVVYGEPGSIDVKEELMQKLQEVAQMCISGAYDITQEAADNYLKIKNKYAELLIRHRTAARNHMAELVVLRHKVGRQSHSTDIDMSEIEVSDVTFYDALKLQDDDNRDLCLNVINERLRELLGAPNQFMRDFIQQLFPSGQGPDWLEGKVGIASEELQASQDNAAFLENQLKIAKSRIVELERDLEEVIRAANEAREEEAAKLKALTLVNEEVPAPAEMSEPPEPVIPDDILNKLEHLTEECSQLKALVDSKDSLLAEKDLKILDLENGLSNAQSETRAMSEELNSKLASAAAVVPDRSEEVAQLTKTLKFTTSQLDAELARHTVTRQELKKMRNQFSASAQEVRSLEEQYATVCTDLQDEKTKRDQVMQQMRALQQAVSQLQLKLKVMEKRTGQDTEVDVGVIDIAFAADKPWMSVFERLFQDAVDKIRRLEKRRESSRRVVMKSLLEVIDSFWKTCPADEETKKPPPAPSFAISSEMTSFLVVSKKLRPERIPKPVKKHDAKLKPMTDSAEPGAVLDLLGDVVPQQASRRSSSVPKLHPSESAPYRQLRRSQMMTSVPSASYKLDAMDIVSGESWEEKCRRKRHEMVHSNIGQCPDCSNVVPSLGLGWCMPKQASEIA